ncbi:MAG TPA: P-II family nitrogen regulator [Mariprofundaceae bacterium]|nr:P-II family nitrogen regulator [Mariprofundaceae bacterium]
MRFKLLIALVDEKKTEKIMTAAREAGATGATIIGSARGEGLNPQKTFFGLSLDTHREMLMFLVEEHLSRKILEKIAEVGEFDSQQDRGVAFQMDVEDVVGLKKQIQTLMTEVEEKL